MMADNSPSHLDTAQEGEVETASQIPEPTQPPLARLQATLQPLLNAALWQNNVPILSELVLTNLGPDSLGEVTVDLTSQPAFLRPKAWRLQQLRPGQIHVVA